MFCTASGEEIRRDSDGCVFPVWKNVRDEEIGGVGDGAVGCVDDHGPGVGVADGDAVGREGLVEPGLDGEDLLGYEGGGRGATVEVFVSYLWGGFGLVRIQDMGDCLGTRGIRTDIPITCSRPYCVSPSFKT
jgi:hypothetical protein